MPRRYAVSFENVTVAAVQDLISIKAAAGKQCRIMGMQISSLQTSSAIPTPQMLALKATVFIGAPTQGSGGSTPTAIPFDAGDSAAGFTSHANDTSQVTGGTAKEVFTGGCHVQAGFVYQFPIPPIVGPAEIFSFALYQAPTSVVLSGSVDVEETGG